MRHARSVIPAGQWHAKDAASEAVLTFDERYRRRVLLNDSAGEFLLDLEKPRILADGDGLVLDDGAIILVRAADEEVADVTAPTPYDLARIAYHIGNRHTPLQVLREGGLRFRDDGVLSKMARQLGGEVIYKQAPFTPEPGAYTVNIVKHDHGFHFDLHHGHKHEH
jgi:urease accessory protein